MSSWGWRVVFTGACWDTCVMGDEDTDTAVMVVSRNSKGLGRSISSGGYSGILNVNRVPLPVPRGDHDLLTVLICTNQSEFIRPLNPHPHGFSYIVLLIVYDMEENERCT